MIRRLFGAEPLATPRLLSGSAAEASGAGGPGRDRLRVLTWNVHKQTHPDFPRDFQRLLDGHRPDILHLQEARIEAAAALLARRNEGWHWMASPNLRLGDGSSAGLLTASRRAPSRGEALLSEGREPLLGSRKPMLACEVPWGDAKVLCLNLHALNFQLRVSGYLAQVERLLRMAVAHQGPVLLSGDFNSWNPYRLSLLMYHTGDAWLKRIEHPWDARRWGRLVFPPLDHVFYSSEHLRPAPDSSRVLTEVRSSDHAPLLADLIRTG